VLFGELLIVKCGYFAVHWLLWSPTFRYICREFLNVYICCPRAFRNARDFHTRSVGLGSSSLCMNCHFCSIMRIIRRTSPHIPHSLKNRQMLSTAAASVTSVMIVAISIIIYIFTFSIVALVHHCYHVSF